MVMEDLEKEKLIEEFKPCLTHDIRLSGGKFNDPDEWCSYFDEKVKNTPARDKKDIIKLLHHYGKNTDTILDFAGKLEGENKRLRAEIWYVINYEGVTTISDFLIRRTGMLFFERPKIEKILPAAISAFDEFLKPGKEVLESQRIQFMRAYENALSFK
jgi:glycerol-3-phosphate dehydrogenase